MGLTIAAMLGRLISRTGTTSSSSSVFYATALSKAKLSRSVQQGPRLSGMSTVGWIKQGEKGRCVTKLSPGAEDEEVSVHLMCGQRHHKSNCRMDKRAVEEAELGKIEKCV